MSSSPPIPEAAFTSAHLSECPVRSGPPTQATAKKDESEEMSDHEKDKLMEQLQMLGYME